MSRYNTLPRDGSKRRRSRLRGWVGGFLSLVAASAAEARPLCDIAFANEAALRSEWALSASTVSDDPEGRGQQATAVCLTCTPKITTEMWAVALERPHGIDSQGRPVHRITVGEIFADENEKRQFLAWFESQNQLARPACKVTAGIVGRRTIGNVDFAVMRLAAGCGEQQHEYANSLQYLGFTDACAYRVAFAWPGIEPMSAASSSSVERLLEQLNWGESRQSAVPGLTPVSQVPAKTR